MQRRLRDLGANERARRALVHRSTFRDALTWMEIHGGLPDIVEGWKTLVALAPSEPPPADAAGRRGRAARSRAAARRRRRRVAEPRPTPE